LNFCVITKMTWNWGQMVQMRLSLMWVGLKRVHFFADLYLSQIMYNLPISNVMIRYTYTFIKHTIWWSRVGILERQNHLKRGGGQPSPASALSPPLSHYPKKIWIRPCKFYKNFQIICVFLFQEKVKVFSKSGKFFSKIVIFVIVIDWKVNEKL